MDISLFMSAASPECWQRMYESLQGNKCSYEIVAVGPNKPKWKLPSNFRFYECHFKPATCYAAASYFCKGEIIGYSTDDSQYNSYSLDKIWEIYQWTKGKPGKYIFSQRTIENGKDVTEEHHFFRHCKDTPVMCPMAFMNREWFFNLGGIDRNFICGQYENLWVCDALADGGEIINVPESRVYLNHDQVHGGIWNKIKYKFGKKTFRNGYCCDRRYLEECYVEEGFGTYDENTLKHGTVSAKRLLPHHPYNYSNILTVPQGEQGDWKK